MTITHPHSRPEPTATTVDADERPRLRNQGGESGDELRSETTLKGTVCTPTHLPSTLVTQWPHGSKGKSDRKRGQRSERLTQNPKKLCLGTFNGLPVESKPFQSQD